MEGAFKWANFDTMHFALLYVGHLQAAKPDNGQTLVRVAGKDISPRILGEHSIERLLASRNERRDLAAELEVDQLSVRSLEEGKQGVELIARIAQPFELVYHRRSCFIRFLKRKPYALLPWIPGTKRASVRWLPADAPLPEKFGVVELYRPRAERVQKLGKLPRKIATFHRVPFCWVPCEEYGIQRIPSWRVGQEGPAPEDLLQTFHEWDHWCSLAKHTDWLEFYCLQMWQIRMPEAKGEPGGRRSDKAA